MGWKIIGVKQKLKLKNYNHNKKKKNVSYKNLCFVMTSKLKLCKVHKYFAR